MCIEKSEEDEAEGQHLWKHKQCKRTPRRRCCCERRITIHRSAIESIIRHRNVNNGRSTTKGDGDGAM
jgi:hypothetical protein